MTVQVHDKGNAEELAAIEADLEGAPMAAQVAGS